MRRMLIVLLAVGLLAGACGESKDPSQDPQGALVSAFEKMNEGDGQSITLSVQSDPGSLVALSEKGEGSPIDADLAEKILSSSISFGGNNTKDLDDARGNVVFNIAGEDAVEMRILGSIVYLRADVPYLLDTFGGDEADLGKAREAADRPGLEFITPALEGEWLALRGLEELQKAGGASPRLLADQQQKLFRELTVAIEEDAKVTHEGTDDAGDHLLVAIPLRKAYEDFRRYMTQLSGSFPTGTPGGFPDASEVPDEDALIDMWVRDGALTQLEFDLIKNKALLPEAPPEGVEKVALRIAIEEFDEEVEVPDGATDVDLKTLMGAFLGGMGGVDSAGSGSAGTPEIDCSLYKNASPEVKKAISGQCPEYAN